MNKLELYKIIRNLEAGLQKTTEERDDYAERVREDRVYFESVLSVMRQAGLQPAGKTKPEPESLGVRLPFQF
jgi:hypothetical protein